MDSDVATDRDAASSAVGDERGKARGIRRRDRRCERPEDLCWRGRFRERPHRLSRGGRAASHRDPEVAVANGRVKIAELILALGKDLEGAVEQCPQLVAGHCR
jgi:hypothetical protein